MNYWEITVLAATRLGCNLDYDKFRTPDEGHGIPAIYRILCRYCDEICEQFLEPIAQAVRLI